MCGLFGMVGHGILQSDIDALKQLGLVSQLRGTHGFGMVKASWKGVETFKDSEDFNTCTNVFPKIMTGVNNKTFMGHVRHATVGELSPSNTHPFEFDSFIGAHNGTLVDAEYFDPDTTDSEQMFAAVQQLITNEGLSLDDALSSVLSGLDELSAYAISVLDKENGEVLFAHNHRRPLAFAFNKDRAVKYWASEMAMLEFILDRNGIDYEEPVNPYRHKVLRIDPSDIIPARRAGYQSIYTSTEVDYTPPPARTNIIGGKWRTGKKPLVESSTKESTTEGPIEDTTPPWCNRCGSTNKAHCQYCSEYSYQSF